MTQGTAQSLGWVRAQSECAQCQRKMNAFVSYENANYLNTSTVEEYLLRERSLDRFARAEEKCNF